MIGGKQSFWKNPSFAVHGWFKTQNRHGSLLLTGFIAACLLQISKIATILRQTAGLVVRFQHSHSIATGTFANVGIKGSPANY